MIVKDEELTLDRILQKVVRFADELIIVDTGSTDNSKNIAKKYNIWYNIELIINKEMGEKWWEIQK